MEVGFWCLLHYWKLLVEKWDRSLEVDFVGLSWRSEWVRGLRYEDGEEWIGDTIQEKGPNVGSKVALR